jgi:hypothetical protein
MVLYGNGIFISLYLVASVAGVALLQGRAPRAAGPGR